MTGSLRLPRAAKELRKSDLEPVDAFRSGAIHNAPAVVGLHEAADDVKTSEAAVSLVRG